MTCGAFKNPDYRMKAFSVRSECHPALWCRDTDGQIHEQANRSPTIMGKLQDFSGLTIVRELGHAA
jgi:hypothetical protein